MRVAMTPAHEREGSTSSRRPAVRTSIISVTSTNSDRVDAMSAFLDKPRRGVHGNDLSVRSVQCVTEGRIELT